MIIARLMGGLGNQMFQYAAARRLAHAHQTILKLDVSWFAAQISQDCPQTYRLGSLNIHEHFATFKEIVQLTGLSPSMKSSGVRRFLRRITRIRPASQITENKFSFNPGILTAPKDAYLNGHWQSERYFQDVEHLIRSEFELKKEPNELNAAMAQTIRNTESVCIHVRRGDYVSDPKVNRIHGLCTLDYYMSAVQKLTESLSEPHFFVFSDDPEWTTRHFGSEYRTTYITHNTSDEAHEDLRLMGLCKHHIIANSSFSWWGAWLSTHRRKIVIAPRKWFNDSSIDTRDLIPHSWVTI